MDVAIQHIRAAMTALLLEPRPHDQEVTIALDSLSRALEKLLAALQNQKARRG